MTSYEERVNGFYTRFIKAAEKQVNASETLTIEEWKAERNCLSSSFLSTTCSPCKGRASF